MLKRNVYKSTLILLLLFFNNAVYCEETNSPKLVLLITIDQLRGDMPWKYKERFAEGGFRYLMDKGVAYKNAHYQHSNTLTAVGHATIVTGGNTAQHGIPGNYWYDLENDKTVYCVEDHTHTILGEAADSSQGTSPANLTGSTIGDELILANGKKSRVYSVSLKDRGAIIPAGHLGKAFWYSSKSGRFVSSNYYFDAYPDWTKKWNEAGKAEKYMEDDWELLYQPDSYLYSKQDNRPAEQHYKKLGITFPHKLFHGSLSDYYATLRFTPMADELTLDFSKALIEKEALGQKEFTDFLAISFSATDYIGHLFGPDSLEAEDNILRLDLTLQKLFSFIDKTIGLENILIVLSSDHGIVSIPEARASKGLPAGRNDPESLIASMNARLKRAFSIKEDLISAYLHPSIYLNEKLIKQKGLDTAKVERVLADEIVKTPGIVFAATKTDLLLGKTIENQLYRKVRHAFHPKLSGNVLVVQEQFWFLNEDVNIATVHGSPYSYDTHVPIFFAGMSLKHKTLDKLVRPNDIAVTIASYLSIPAPSGSVGNVLDDIFDN